MSIRPPCPPVQASHAAGEAVTYRRLFQAMLCCWAPHRCCAPHGQAKHDEDANSHAVTQECRPILVGTGHQPNVQQSPRNLLSHSQNGLITPTPPQTQPQWQLGGRAAGRLRTRPGARQPRRPPPPSAGRRATRPAHPSTGRPQGLHAQGARWHALQALPPHSAPPGQNPVVCAAPSAPAAPAQTGRQRAHRPRPGCRRSLTSQSLQPPHAHYTMGAEGIEST